MPMNRARHVYLPVVMAVSGLLLFGVFRGLHHQESFTYSRVLMGTVVEITLREDSPELADTAFREMERLTALFSTYREDSELSRINSTAGRPVKVSPEVAELVGLALKVCRLTDGAFDPTVGSVVRFWNFGPGGRIPPEDELKKALSSVGCQNIVLDRDSGRVTLSRKGVSLDPGGIAKGYIVDRALEVLKKRGVRWVIINAGGDVAFYSASPSERFRIGIRHPDIEGRLLGILVVKSGAVATSGDYERYFIRDGVRYHHIIDPRTGLPARGLRSVTIVSGKAYLADALATAVFVMGKERGLKLVEDLDGVEAVVVDEDMRIYTSSGLKDAFTPVEE